MEWLGAAQSPFGLLAAGVVSAQYIILPSQSSAFTGCTLVRTRGQLVARGENVAGVIADMVGAAGITVWTDNDDNAPAAADRLDPFVDTDHDWLWHTFLYRQGGNTLAQQYEPLTVDIDSRAMRKLGQNKGLLLMIRNAGANGIVYGWGARCLLKE